MLQFGFPRKQHSGPHFISACPLPVHCILSREKFANEQLPLLPPGLGLTRRLSPTYFLLSGLISCHLPPTPTPAPCFGCSKLLEVHGPHSALYSLCALFQAAQMAGTCCPVTTRKSLVPSSLVTSPHNSDQLIVFSVLPPAPGRLCFIDPWCSFPLFVLKSRCLPHTQPS